MRLQLTHNLSQDCVIWQEIQKGYHQSRPKRTMTNMLSVVFCSDLALFGKEYKTARKILRKRFKRLQIEIELV